MSELDPVITYGSFGQVRSLHVHSAPHPALQAHMLCVDTACESGSTSRAAYVAGADVP